MTDWSRRGLLLIAGVALLRVLWLWLVPFDLVGDEAYYWDWGRHPAWCYYSKPPMIGWLNTLTQHLGWRTTATVRLPAALLGTASLLAAWLLARHLWDARTAFFAVVLAAIAPGTMVLSTLLTPDAPLLAAWGVCLYTLWRALECGSVRWWTVYALVGVLGVWSKQMMLLLPLCALAFLVTRPTFLAVRASTLLWLSSPLLALPPLILWNAQHGWIMLHHTAAHFDGDRRSLWLAAEYVGSQFGIVGPVTLVIFVWAAAAWREARSHDGTWFVWMMSVPALFVMLLMSLRQRMLPNWPAAFHFSGVLLAAAWLAHEWPRRRRWWQAAWMSGVCLSVLAYGLVLLYNPLGLPGSPLDLARRLRGWSRMGQEIGAYQARLEGPLIVVACGRRQLASEMAFYLPDQPRVWLWTPPEPVNSQYALWDGPLPAHRGSSALLVCESDHLPAQLQGDFEQVRPLGFVPASPHGGAPAVWLWVGDNLRNW